MAIAFTSILAVQRRNNSSAQSTAVAVPAGLSIWTVRVDLATTNDFTDPVNQALLLDAQFSFDGGVTFQDVGGGTVNGSTTGWGKNGAANPFISGAVPTDPSYPTHVRGRYAQTGTFHFGLSVEAS